MNIISNGAMPPVSRIAYRRNLLTTLREREVARVGGEMAATKALSFRAAADGETLTGKFTLARLRTALEAEGVIFIEADDAIGPGVRLELKPKRNR